MRLDKDIEVCINCRTQEEQYMILDIFESLDKRWSNGRKASNFKILLNPPMSLINYNKGIMQGHVSNKNTYNGMPVVEAKDFKNQWISLKKVLTNR